VLLARRRPCLTCCESSASAAAALPLLLAGMSGAAAALHHSVWQRIHLSWHVVLIRRAHNSDALRCACVAYSYGPAASMSAWLCFGLGMYNAWFSKKARALQKAGEAARAAKEN
jgi:hypothetical protein